METEQLTLIFNKLREKELSVEEALVSVRKLSPSLLGYAHLDHERGKRTGIPEVIFGADKTAAQMIGIMEKMLTHSSIVMATRVDSEKAEAVCKRFKQVTYHREARMLCANEQFIPKEAGRGKIMVLTAGTSDIPVAEEAYWTASYLGHEVEKKYDVGVAGIHRLFSCLEDLKGSTVVIVVAGMEGALPSVVAGLIESPVVAVPTSVGYGAGAGGFAALLGMLNSCSPGVAVVNIDNGFGAACMAAAINRK
jgi:hypothetical protein